MGKSILFGVIAFGFCTGMLAQKTNGEYINYEDLALRDARYEQTMVMLNDEDERDYWKDQKKYENDLRRLNQNDYHSYMTVKSHAHSLHAKHCSSLCNHRDLYFKFIKHYTSYLDFDSSQYTTHYLYTGIPY
ncbi:hypothetical protein [Flagellimonas meishanensis]|uniref:hypothetical protein n=1 Tax=Flagellimonas meishanensis TaxID=2873264 RepID=UPI001CA6CA43|nr:hypothetical protein [[Muricauda] meishanensis]